jgi:hypothetical protein
MKLRMLLLVTLLIALPSSASENEITGTWEYSGPSESGLWLKTLQNGNVVHFQLEISRGAPAYNSGWIEGDFTLSGTSGVFQSSEYNTCTIVFEFKKSSVLIHEAQEDNQDCGFGRSVHANGTLVKKNHGKPKFSNGDPRHSD